MAKKPVSPVDFGAKGDGVTDDTEAFTTALEVTEPEPPPLVLDLFSIWRTLNATAHNTDSFADRLATARPGFQRISELLATRGYVIVDGKLKPE